MKVVLSLIPVLGMFTTGVLVFVPKSASAYCVYNKAAFTVKGEDTRKNNLGFLNKYWQKELEKDAKDCCPGDHEECQGATIHVTGEQKSSCEAAVDARGWIVIHSISTPDGIKLECKVNEPV
jgi:hypothetical protein